MKGIKSIARVLALRGKRPTEMGPPFKPELLNAYPVEQGPKVNLKSILDRSNDDPGEIRILPKELREEIRKKITKKSSASDDKMLLVFDYLQKLVSDGLPLEEALRITFENVYPEK